jgi:polyhydroxybutyrate depolymerase
VRRASGLLFAASLLLGAAACSRSSSDGERATSTTVPEATTTTLDPADPASVPVDPSAGCGTEPDVARIDPDEAPGDVEQPFTSGGVERVYRLGVPATYDPAEAAPLIVNLHGSGSNAVQASAYSDLPRRAADRGMVTVAPEAIGGQWELAGEGSDGDFLAALVDDLEGRYCIDRNRVHLAGMSLGAWKAAATACSFDGRFASLGLVTVEVFPGDCDPISVVAFHGRADFTVPYGEGGTVDPSGSPNEGVTGTLANIASWAENAGCDAEPAVERIGDDVEDRRYEGCDLGLDVELYTIDEGGHTWPGSAIEIGATTQTIDATDLILDWFEAHPRRTER